MYIVEIILLAIILIVLREVIKNFITNLHCTVVEQYLYINSAIQLDDWLELNPGVYVGISEVGRNHVLKCINYLQFIVKTRNELGLSPIESIDTVSTLKFLFSLLDDFPTLPPEITMPAASTQRAFIST